MPSLAVNHRGIADALKQMDAIDNRGEHVADVGAKLRPVCGRVHLVVQAIETLPLLGGDLFAHLARIFARALMQNVTDAVMCLSKMSFSAMRFERRHSTRDRPDCQAKRPAAASASRHLRRRCRASGSS